MEKRRSRRVDCIFESNHLLILDKGAKGSRICFSERGCVLNIEQAKDLNPQVNRKGFKDGFDDGLVGHCGAKEFVESGLTKPFFQTCDVSSV